jgi:hypothetical protein
MFLNPSWRKSVIYRTPLETACSRGHTRIVDPLLDPTHGLTLPGEAYENAMRFLVRKPRTILCDACEYGNEHLATTMIDAYSWDVAYKSKNMGVPLFYVAEQGQAQMVKTILARGAERVLDFP